MAWAHDAMTNEGRELNKARPQLTVLLPSFLVFDAVTGPLEEGESILRSEKCVLHLRAPELDAKKLAPCLRLGNDTC